MKDYQEVRVDICLIQQADIITTSPGEGFKDDIFSTSGTAFSENE